MCKISVVIPAYNSGKTIEKTVQSVLNQTYTDFEIIIINDGSKDDTLEQCEKIKSRDSRIKVVNVENGGVSRARNIGIKNSVGQYLVFLDSDDIMENTLLEKMIKNHEEDCLCVAGYSREWKKDGKVIKRKDYVWSTDEKISIVEQSEFVKFYRKTFASNVWNKLYVKKIILENEILFLEDLSLGEDLCFNLEYFEKTSCKFKIINQPLYYYGDTTTGLNRRFRLDSIEICERLYMKLFAFLRNVQNISEESMQKLNKMYINEMVNYAKNMILYDKRKDRKKILLDKLNKTMLYDVVEKMYRKEEVPKLLYKSILNKHILISKVLLKLYKMG